MASIADRVFDSGLTVLDTEATHIHVCSAEPTVFGTLNSLGNKNFGAGGCFGAPADRTGGGRKVSSTAVTDGSVTSTGTATHWAVTDTTNSRLLATGALASSQAVTSGNTFTLSSFDIGIADPT
jgi:hypothetical protein